MVTNDALLVLEALATREPGAPIDAEQVEARQAQRAVRALGLLRQLKAIGDDDLPATSSLLVTISRQTFLAQQAGIEADRLVREREIVERKLDAMISETAFLDASKQMVSEGQKTKAVRRYADAWTRGRTQVRVADQALEEIQRSAWLAREQAAIAARFDLIDPALSELQAYAAGGITAELIARYLSVLGLGAIAYGVN